MAIMKIFSGIDEAGRGPVLGPMVMAIVSGTKKDILFLKKIGVKDSKLLSEKKRNELFKIIKEQFNYFIIKVKPEEIDKFLNGDMYSLNDLEAITSAKLINNISKKLIPNEVMMDLPSKNKEKYLDLVHKKINFKKLKMLDETFKDILLNAEFKADINYPLVSAASILAKVTRDKEIKKYESKLGFKIGSGYPSDKYTIEAVKKHLNLFQKEKIIRTTWKTTKNIIQEKHQSKLGDF